MSRKDTRFKYVPGQQLEMIDTSSLSSATHSSRTLSIITSEASLATSGGARRSLDNIFRFKTRSSPATAALQRSEQASPDSWPRRTGGGGKQRTGEAVGGRKPETVLSGSYSQLADATTKAAAIPAQRQESQVELIWTEEVHNVADVVNDVVNGDDVMAEKKLPMIVKVVGDVDCAPLRLKDGEVLQIFRLVEESRVNLVHPSGQLISAPLTGERRGGRGGGRRGDADRRGGEEERGEGEGSLRKAAGHCRTMSGTPNCKLIGSSPPSSSSTRALQQDLCSPGSASWSTFNLNNTQLDHVTQHVTETTANGLLSHDDVTVDDSLVYRSKILLANIIKDEWLDRETVLVIPEQLNVSLRIARGLKDADDDEWKDYCGMYARAARDIKLDENCSSFKGSFPVNAATPLPRRSLSRNCSSASSRRPQSLPRRLVAPPYDVVMSQRAIGASSSSMTTGTPVVKQFLHLTPSTTTRSPAVETAPYVSSEARLPASSSPPATHVYHIRSSSACSTGTMASQYTDSLYKTTDSRLSDPMSSLCNTDSLFRMDSICRCTTSSTGSCSHFDNVHRHGVPMASLAPRQLLSSADSGQYSAADSPVSTTTSAGIHGVGRAKRTSVPCMGTRNIAHKGRLMSSANSENVANNRLTSSQDDLLQESSFVRCVDVTSTPSVSGHVIGQSRVGQSLVGGDTSTLSSVCDSSDEGYHTKESSKSTESLSYRKRYSPVYF